MRHQLASEPEPATPSQGEAVHPAHQTLGVWVQITQAQGSTPRDVGTGMLVQTQQVTGTLGGGRLEFEAIAQARDALRPAGATPQHKAWQQHYKLGPSLGQCCGGAVDLSFELVDAQGAALRQRQAQPVRQPVAIFGAGHVGTALVALLGTLPFSVSWIDSREGIFPCDLPAGVRCEHSDPVQAAVPELAAQSHVVVMTHSHGLDLDIIAACLQRQRQCADLPYIGLIGSRSKWASFSHRLAQRGYAAHELVRVTCPIGLAGIAGKEPPVIALAVAAQLLQLRPVAAPATT